MANARGQKSEERERAEKERKVKKVEDGRREGEEYILVGQQI